MKLIYIFAGTVTFSNRTCGHPTAQTVDYAISGAMQKRLYHGRKFENVEQLKQALVLVWCALSQTLRFIDGSINQWRRRLQAVVQENGGHMNTSSTSCRHLYSIALFVAYRTLRDELFAGV